MRPAGGADWRPVSVGDAVRVETRVRTGEAGKLSIQIGASTTARLDRESVARLTEPGLSLDAGGVFLCVEPAGAGFVVETPEAAATVHGTRFGIDRRGRDTTVLRVLEGTVSFSNPAGSVDVGPNFSATAKKGSAPGDVRAADHFPALAWAAIDEAGLDFPVDVALEVRQEKDGRIHAGRGVSFLAHLDYGRTRYGDLWLYCRVFDNAGAVVRRQRERVSAGEHRYRYRVRKMVLAPLPRGTYEARFRIGHGARATLADASFTVE
jgi:hypothetical protein